MNITKGKITKAQRVVVYGPEGIGKSSLAAQFPNPVFIDVESGTAQLDVARTDKPTSWAMLKSIVTDLRRDNQGFLTLVIDTADAAERLVMAHVCAVGQKDSIEDYGFGKGFTKMAEEYAKFLDMLTDVAESGMHVVLLAHSMLRKFEQPDEFGSYDRFTMKLSKQVEPLVKEWCDMLLFANYETILVKDDKTKSVKAAGGERVIHTEHHVAWDAKNRHDLTAKIAFPKVGAFAAIAHCFAVGTTTVKPTQTPVAKAETPQATPQAAPQATTATEDITAFNSRLYDLMERDGIADNEIQAIVAKRGYFPLDTPLHNYPDEFVDGVLVSCWDKVRNAIIASR